ncbi:hypothetical protein NOMA109596_04390 [Nocardioides marinus]|uniref:hypothetical protein n=1 Tax=Nocardioides marinus TaxID=374514 RepID=UPI0039EFEE91
MQREGDDEAWRSIVENFGERAELDDEHGPAPATPPEQPARPDPYAWAGVVGSPLLLLVSLLFGIGLPSWVGYLMVAWFVGGFCYLVARMPKEPRDPWDDGSRV